MTETVLTNARIVLADEVVHGSVLIEDGIIRAIGSSNAKGDDLDGDYLVPGLVELHTDHLEGHYAPRPGVRWPALSALQAHDAQIAASGITTVFDALRVGIDDDSGMTVGDMTALGQAIKLGVAEDRLRAEHYIHLRCEVSAPDCIEGLAVFADDPLVQLASMMDHSPGQRQFASIEAVRNYYGKKRRMTEAELDDFLARRSANSEKHAKVNRDAVAQWAVGRGVVLASHDDATAAHVAEAEHYGIRVAEFPTTLEAAEASRKAGLSVLMGAPNVVRGGSHSGNVSAGELAHAGLLDILSSDYVPLSLMQAAFLLGANDLPRAIALVTANPAAAVGLTDRGEIAVGKRADLVHVSSEGPMPIVRRVWREGRRVS